MKTITSVFFTMTLLALFATAFASRGFEPGTGFAPPVESAGGIVTNRLALSPGSPGQVHTVLTVQFNGGTKMIGITNSTRIQGGSSAQSSQSMFPQVGDAVIIGLTGVSVTIGNRCVLIAGSIVACDFGLITPPPSGDCTVGNGASQP